MKTFIIAEIGVNHNGDMDVAERLIALAAQAGCDAVKFQTFNSAELVTEACEKSPYQMANDGVGTQLEMLQRFELSHEQHLQLARICQNHGIEFMSTAFGIAELDMLIKVGIQRIKIASGEITNLPFLRSAAAKRLPLLLSTGMANLSDIEHAVDNLIASGCPRDQITLLHCTSLYPAPSETVNLRAMDTLRDAFGVDVGYSDHTLGIGVAIAAVARGARVIEKHVTSCNRTCPGQFHETTIRERSGNCFVGTPLGCRQKANSTRRNLFIRQPHLQTTRKGDFANALGSTHWDGFHTRLLRR
jgi:N,N'-diacetyllegionaminate synthase